MRSVLFVLAFVLLVARFAAAASAADYTLVIDRQAETVDGKSSQSLTINGQLPGPTLHFKEGEDVTIKVTNRLHEDASMHWHGILLPALMDGVPGLNGYSAIKPGETFTYHFPIRQAGTYWYHSHSGTQEQDGLYGSIVIDPVKPDYVQAQRDYVIMLSDFSPQRGVTILSNLKTRPGYYNRGKRTVGDFVRDAGRDGVGATISDRLDWGQMRMDPTDLADVTGYTFLVNGKSADQNWTGLFKPGEHVRLRFINASSMSYYDVRIPGLKMIVVQADGSGVEPVPVDEFRIAVAETYDVIVTPKDDKAYTIFAEPIDRSGFARATLAPREGMTGEMPERRPRAVLSMSDMSGGMAGMDHGAMDQGAKTPGDMQGMDGMANMPGMTHDAPAGSAPSNDGRPVGWANASTPPGSKALTYADLKSYEPQADVRPAEREIVVRLGGNMERYIWTINGVKGDQANPIDLRHGERVKLTFVNESMMAHPMHLHGMFVQLVNGQPADRLPNKHIVNVAPGTSYSVMLTASEPGEWAFHCHLLYHMASGMMTKVVVARLASEAKP